MKRRGFIVLLGGAAAWPLVARAQQKAMPVVGYLSVTSAPSSPNMPFLAAFAQGLSETDYVEGQNRAMDYRWAEGRRRFVGRKIDVILPAGQAAALAAKTATSTIPIVFTGVGDPVGVGLVSSLARPGGNVTGFSNIADELNSKWVELLSELVPQAKVIALLVDPNQPTTERAGAENSIERWWQTRISQKASGGFLQGDQRAGDGGRLRSRLHPVPRNPTNGWCPNFEPTTCCRPVRACSGAPRPVGNARPYHE